MGMTWNIEARIELYPITTEDFEKVLNPFVEEPMENGIKDKKIKLTESDRIS